MNTPARKEVAMTKVAFLKRKIFLKEQAVELITKEIEDLRVELCWAEKPRWLDFEITDGRSRSLDNDQT